MLNCNCVWNACVVCAVQQTILIYICVWLLRSLSAFFWFVVSFCCTSIGFAVETYVDARLLRCGVFVILLLWALIAHTQPSNGHVLSFVHARRRSACDLARFECINCYLTCVECRVSSTYRMYICEPEMSAYLYFQIDFSACSTYMCEHSVGGKYAATSMLLCSKR